MTYVEGGEGFDIMSKVNIKIANDKAYLKLSQCEDLGPPPAVRVVTLETADEKEEEVAVLVEPSTPIIRCDVAFKWVKLVLLFAFLGFLAGAFFKWIGPFLMNKEVMPIIIWETSTFSYPVLAVILFLSVAFFPALFLPSTPSMWVAGMTFGYGFGFLIIFSAVSIGVSLPYFIGNLFYHKIQGWLERYPKNASVIRLAGEGDWMKQFQVVFLIRVSPFPYILYNYCAVATNVNYVPYFFGSMVGMIPDVLVAIYTGIVICTLEDASHKDHGLSSQQIIFDILGFIMTTTTTVTCTILAKKRLNRIQMEDDLLLG